MACKSIELGPLQEAELKSLARRLAEVSDIGDVLLLEGPVGAGKTTFARAFIQQILVEPEDVPSPTFTLVQAYETAKGSLWHCDLYRIGSIWEVEELGLTEAFDTAICLIEWPQILGELAPANALRLRFDGSGDTRSLTAVYQAKRWEQIGWEHAGV